MNSYNDILSFLRGGYGGGNSGLSGVQSAIENLISQNQYQKMKQNSQISPDDSLAAFLQGNKVPYSIDRFGKVAMGGGSQGGGWAGATTV